jgi:hypothetical protein
MKRFLLICSILFSAASAQADDCGCKVELKVHNHSKVRFFQGGLFRNRTRLVIKGCGCK